MPDEANLPTDRTAAYRQDRRAFIAAATAAGTDAIARVHPAKGPDGKPLFCDSAAFGPRHAKRAILVIGGPLTLAALAASLPAETRLVLVHALDPLAVAMGQPDPSGWPQRMLADIAIEELRYVEKLAVLDAEGSNRRDALTAALPQAQIVLGQVDAAAALAQLRSAIAALRDSGL